MLKDKESLRKNNQRMNEQELKAFASQLRCPKGEEGIAMGERMNGSNNNMIHSTINELQWNDYDTVVEIGPGNGYHIATLLQDVVGMRYYGVDISQTMIDQATQRNKQFVESNKVSFYLTSEEVIPLANEVADKVITVNTIYFWQQPALYLKEIYRVLKPGGQLAIAFATEAFMKNLPFVQYGFQLYTVSKVVSLFEQAGFGIQKTVRLVEQVQMSKESTIEREFYIVVAQK